LKVGSSLFSMTVTPWTIASTAGHLTVELGHLNSGSATELILSSS
jgi:hypothetical protein